MVTANPNAPSLVATPTEASCGESNGSIDLSVSPTGSYTYNWSNGANTEDLINIPAGFYEVTVTATGGCSATNTVEVVDTPTNINITGIPFPNVSCTNSNGAVDTTVSPAGAYDFDWSNGATTEDLTNIAAGSYTVTVTDNGGCTASASFAVANNTMPPETTATATPDTCSQNLGSIDQTVSPAGDYTFLWSNGATTEDLANLAAGTYTVTTTSTTTGCTATVSATVTNTMVNLSATGVVTQPTGGQNNGAIDLTISPTGTYTYNWSNGATTEDIMGLGEGTYTVTVSAGGECTATASFVLAEVGCTMTVSISVDAPNPGVVCVGDDITISANVTGGTAPYSYAWSNGMTTQSFTVPAPYNQTLLLTVTDSDGCTALATVHIKINVWYVDINYSTFPTCFGDSLALIASTTAEIPGTTYTWSTGETGFMIFVTSSGTYSVSMTHPNVNCTAEATATVTLGTAPAPVPQIIGPTSLCPGQSATLTVNGGPFSTYVWSDGSSDPTLTITGPGGYFVTVTNAEGCTGEDFIDVQAGGSAPFLNDPTPICPGQSTTVEVINPAGFTDFLWSNGGTGPSITVTTPGTYIVTVTAAGGCTAVGSADVLQISSNLSITGAVTNVTACTTPNGAVNITVLPTGTYDFDWSNGPTTEDIANVAAGSYTVTVTEPSGCTASQSFAVLENVVSPSLSTIITPASCGQNNGAVDLSVSPTGSYTFLWSNGANTEDLVNIAEGNYEVTVTSSTTGCTAMASATVQSSGSSIGITGNAMPVTNCTAPNGTIDITTSPTGTYTYNWSNGANMEDLVDIAAGSYTVTVTAGGNCTTSASFVVEENVSQPSLTATIIPSVCGDPIGAIDLSVAPAGSYVFSWSNGAGTEDLTGLVSGDYSVIATAVVTGCTATASYNVPNNSTSFTLTGSSSPVTICGAPNGQINLSISPSGAYDFLWSNGETTEDLQNIAAGNYTVTVTQVGACTGEASFQVLSQAVLPLLSQNASPASCGQPNGSVDLSVTPASGNSYVWSNGASSEDLQNITAGSYAVTVTSANGCTATTSAAVQENSPTITLTGSATANTSCTGANGSIDLTASPAGVYTFLWSNGETTEDLQNLASGSYTVTVTEGANCTSTATYDVPNNAGAPNLTTTANPSVCGENNGTVDLTVSPTGVYTFLWSNGETTEDLQNLAPASYSVTTTVANGCTSVASVVVTSDTINFNLNGNVSPNTSCATPDGNIDLSMSLPGSYSFSWSSGETTEDLQNISAGTYEVTVTQGISCTATSSFTVPDESTAPAISQTASPSNCGQNDGAIDITISPSGVYVFSWSNGVTTEDLQNIAAGNYSVTITAGNGCTTTAAAEVVNNAAGFNLSATPSANNSCAFANGAIDLSYSPLGNYTFIWSNGATTEDLQNIAAGSYGVTVTATASGCTNVGSYTVVENAVIPLATATPTAATCGQANGSASLSVTPAGTYNYMWTNGSTAANLQNVVAGVYDVTVTGANGCSATATAEVTENTTSFALTATPTANNSCVSANGSIDLSTSPSGNYTYIWSNGATTEDLQGIAAGSYIVTVTAAGNCSSTGSYTIPDESGAPALAAAADPSVCGENNGNVDITASPSGNYTFLWTNGATTEDLQNIAAGNYTVTVTDANGCSSTTTATVADNTLNFTANGAVSANTSCTASNGSIELAMSLPGTYNFLWSNGATSQNLQNLPAGSYAVTVTQGITCLTTADYIVQEESGTPAISTAINPANCGQTNGSISLNVSPATGNSFQWSNGETTQSLQNIAAGNYEVTCTGANGCTVSEVITVPSESTDISLSAQPSGNSSCINPDGVIDLTISSTTTYDILWSNGATTEDLNSLPVGSYTVTVTDADGCSESAAYLVPGPAQPSVAVAGPASACQGTAATLSAGGGFSSYLWSNGATTSSISVSQTDTYAVTATDVNGCTATANSNFQNLPIPMPGISGPSSICGGDAVFSITGGNFPQIIWSNGATSQSITISQPAIYSVTVTNADGCTGVASQELSVGSSLLPVIATDATNCDGTASLDAGAGYASYLWSNGSTTQTLSVNANGTYAVTVSDGTGCTGSGTTNLSIPTPPQVQISGASSICQGTGTQFSVPNNFPQIIWSTGATTSVITASQAGTYSVTVTTADGCTATGSQVLTVAPGLSPDISATLVDCGGTFTLEVSGSFANYLWSNGSTASAIIVSTGGNYAVTVSDLAGCTGTASETVTPPQPPIVQIAGAATLCQSDQTDLVAPGDFVQYLWNTGETGPQITISQGGIYGVTVSDANGCTASAEWSVTALLSEIVVVETTACSPQDTGTVTVVLTNQFGCDSTVVTATVLAQPVFSTIEMSACAGETAVFNGVEILAGGSQEFIFTGTNGCDSIVYVNVSQLPAVDFGLTAEKTCHNSSDGMVEVTMLGGKAPYQYSLDSGPFQSQPIFTNLSGGSYAVMVEDGNGCVLEQNITVPETLPLEIFTADDTLSCEVGEATLRPLLLSGNAGEVEWTWPDGSQLPWLTVDEAGTYKVVADDGCEVVERAIQVVWDEEYRKTDFFYVPNTFSPNGDGINDLFQVFPGRNFEMVSFEFRVFDRWGDAMFITFDPAEGWDGVYRDIQRQPAVYVWFVKAKVMVCGAREVDVFKEGGVTIMR